VNVATNDQKNQVIRADDVARAMVDVAVLGTGKRRGPIFENRDIQAIVESPPPRSHPAGGDGASRKAGCRDCGTHSPRPAHAIPTSASQNQQRHSRDQFRELIRVVAAPCNTCGCAMMIRLAILLTSATINASTIPAAALQCASPMTILPCSRHWSDWSGHWAMTRAALHQPRISWHRLTLDNSLVPSPTSGMNGFELKRELSMRHSSLPVIMITARAEPDIEEKAMSSGATCFLRKPFEAQTLVSCLQRVLSI
jgi:CheY-like chemotaxis protein